MKTRKLKDSLEKAREYRALRKDVNDCSEIYSPAYEAFGVPQELLRLAHHFKPIVTHDTWIPFLFPPCGVPLWGSSHLFIYEWRHWFVDRDVVIVYSNPEIQAVFELARNYRQLGYLIAQEDLVISDGEFGDFDQICKTLGIEDRADIVERWDKAGDIRSVFSTHDAFSAELPQSCLPDDAARYHGDFPYPKLNEVDKLGSTTSFELYNLFYDHEMNRSLRAWAKAGETSPDWLRADNQSEVFERFFDAGDMAGAWMALCSSGWQFASARRAIDRLADHIDDDRFRIQAACWCSLPFSDSQTY